jgi:hypothetical protein
MSTIETKRKDILNFFKLFIEGYALGDLEILKSIKPDTCGQKGCTIPSAMTIISCIDLLGFLIYEKAETGKSAENISNFLKFHPLFPEYYDDITIDKICNYRQGMMHHFFPKFKGQFAGICKNENDSKLFIPHNNNSGEESLNVSVLTKDFINAINKFKIFLETTNEEKILDTMLKGLKNLDYYIQIPSTVTTYTTVNPGTPKNKR